MRWPRALLIGAALLAPLSGCRSCDQVERALRITENQLRETKEELDRQCAINHALQLQLEAQNTPPLVPGGPSIISDKPGVGVFLRVDMRVVEPDQRTGVVRAGTAPGGHRPLVSKGLAGQHGIVFFVHRTRAVVIARAFAGFQIKNAVRMDAGREAGLVFEHDAKAVTNFGAQHRTEQSQVPPIFGAPFSSTTA